MGKPLESTVMDGRSKKIYVDRYLRPVASFTRCVPASVREEARRILRDEGRYSETVALLDAQPEVTSDPLALKLRGVAHLALKQYELAEADFAAARALLARELSAVLCNEAASLLEQDRVTEGLKSAEEAMSIDSAWHLPGVNLLSALALQGKVDEAWNFVMQWLENWPAGHHDPELRSYLSEDGILSILRADIRFKRLITDLSTSLRDSHEH